jgi:hypothetical protein
LPVHFGLDADGRRLPLLMDFVARASQAILGRDRRTRCFFAIVLPQIALELLLSVGWSLADVE